MNELNPNRLTFPNKPMYKYLVTLPFLLFAVYLLTTGEYKNLDVEKLLLANPKYLSSIGIASCVFLSVLGAAIGIYTTGTTLLGAAVREPRVKTKNLISILFCEAVAIFGLIAAIILVTKDKPLTGLFTVAEYKDSFSIFWGGLTVGLCEMGCGIAIGYVGSGAVLADAADPKLFIRVLVIEIFASAVGLFGLIVGLIIVF